MHIVPYRFMSCIRDLMAWHLRSSAGVGDLRRGHGRMANGEAGSGPFWGKPEWRGEEGYYKMLASSYGNLVASGE